MKKIALILAASVFLSGCWGYSSKDNEAMGQVKKVVNNTPIMCPDYVDIDISLGVMRNGVGSMSVHDEYFYVKNDDAGVVAVLKEANRTGQLMVDYDRIGPFCKDEAAMITAVQIVK